MICSTHGPIIHCGCRQRRPQSAELVGSSWLLTLTRTVLVVSQRAKFIFTYMSRLIQVVLANCYGTLLVLYFCRDIVFMSYYLSACRSDKLKQFLLEARKKKKWIELHTAHACLMEQYFFLAWKWSSLILVPGTIKKPSSGVVWKHIASCCFAGSV
jgi:hypothetical protein